MPLGFWVQDALGLARNHYDRLGHFAQGFVPAILAREILLRTSPLRRGRWLFFLVTATCLAISACYEFIEWWAALAGGEAADAFLGTQGDVWDTQWDMFLALIGAITAQLALGRAHDRALASLSMSALRWVAARDRGRRSRLLFRALRGAAPALPGPAAREPRRRRARAARRAGLAREPRRAHRGVPARSPRLRRADPRRSCSTRTATAS